MNKRKAGAFDDECTPLGDCANIDKNGTRRGMHEVGVATPGKPAKKPFVRRPLADCTNVLSSDPTTLSTVMNPTLGLGSNTTTPSLYSQKSAPVSNPTADATTDTVTNPTLGSASIVDPYVDGDDNSWLQRNADWCPAPSCVIQEDVGDELAAKRKLVAEKKHRYRTRKRAELENSLLTPDEPGIPEDCQRSAWCDNSQRYRQHRKGNMSTTVPQLDRNVEFQNRYRRRNSTQASLRQNAGGPRCTTTAPIIRSVPTTSVQGDVFDSGIWEPNGTDLPSFDEEDLDTRNLEGGEFDDFDGDDEGGAFTRPDVRYRSYRVDGQDGGAEGRQDPYDYVYHNLPKKHHVLCREPDCEHCGVKRFPREGAAFCCREGMVRIHIPEVPAEMRRLYTNQTDTDAKWFR
ncbi:hypothetical protein EJB05_42507, partial [Eragrostis curvula]